jgi:hypothetical protein
MADPTYANPTTYSSDEQTTFSPGNYGGSVASRLKQITALESSAAAKQGGTIHDPSAYDPLINQASSLLQMMGSNPKNYTTIYAYLQGLYEKQQKVASTGDKSGIDQRIADYTNLKQIILERNAGNPVNAAYQLSLAVAQLKGDLTTLANDYADRNINADGQPDISQITKVNNLINKDSTDQTTGKTNSGFAKEQQMYDNMLGGYQKDATGKIVVGADGNPVITNPDALSHYGVFYDVNPDGSVQSADIRPVTAADLKDGVTDSNGAPLNNKGMNVYVTTSPTPVNSSGGIQGFGAIMGGLRLQKDASAAGTPATTPWVVNGGDVTKWADNLGLSSGGSVIQNLKTNQMFKMGADYKYHQIDPTLLTPEEKNGATRLSDERFNTNSISGQNYNDYINSEVGKKQVQQNTQLAYTPSFGAQVKQNIDKSFTSSAGGASEASMIKEKMDANPNSTPHLGAKAVEFATGAGKYIGNKVVQAGEAIFKGGK